VDAFRSSENSKRPKKVPPMMNAKNQPISKQKNADAYFAPSVLPLRVGAFASKRVEMPEGARFSVATAEAERFFVLEKILSPK
ncbi:MAG: hypothetical protein IJE77_08430, partial [Thermoguttaceae bacterium]|nr:hypothetical protein [Thermoguttaceae bacterium]